MHTDPELLSLLALGEHVGTDHERQHAATCPTCAGEIAELAEVVALGRAVRDEGALLDPPPDVWSRIRSELALDPSVPATAAASELTGRARLTAVGSWSGASGTAELSTDAEGRRILQVALHADLPHDGIRAAWLIHRDDPTQYQSLGILDGRHGLWTVDHAVDLHQYTILDISQQDIGQTTHSGQSLVRGALTLVG